MTATGRILNLPLIPRFYQYALVILIIGLTILVCSPLSNSQSYHIVSFILLFVVAMLAVFMGIGPVLVASTISATCILKQTGTLHYPSGMPFFRYHHRYHVPVLQPLIIPHSRLSGCS